jgi:hypothetical protein
MVKRDVISHGIRPHGPLIHQGFTPLASSCHNPSDPSKRGQKGCPKRVDFEGPNLWIPEMMRSKMVKILRS